MFRHVFESLVEQIEARFAELERQMSDPQVIGDRERYAEVGREYRELQPASALVAEWRTLKDDLEGARELLAEDGDDPELRKVVEEAPARLEELEEEIRLAMVERDPNDDKNVLVEIRAGTGGDEAALFAGDLYKMLTRYAEERGFATETLSQSAAEVGGFKEVTFAVKGEGAYSVFKFEGGTHRVQRVPETESQGRIHTSTATVAVLPEAEEVEVQIDQNDLQIDVYRSSGPGRPVGQHDRLGGADHPQADRDRRLDAGREVPAPEQGQGDAGAARPAATSASSPSSRRRSPPSARPRSAAASAPRRCAPTTSPGPGHRPPDQADLAQPRRGPRRRPLRVHRRAGGRGEAAEAGGGRGRMTPVAGSVREALVAAIDALQAAGVESPRLDAELLLAEATGRERAALVADPGAELSPAAAAGASARWCGGGCGASRSPTSSAARASATSSWRSTAGC